MKMSMQSRGSTTTSKKYPHQGRSGSGNSCSASGEYRRIRVDEDDDNDDATITGGSGGSCGSCILPCLLLMLIVLSLSLAILFFLTSGHRTHSLWSPFRSNGNLTTPQPDSEATTTASPTSTTEVSINVTDSLVEVEPDVGGHNDTSNNVTDSSGNGTTTFLLSEKDKRLLQFFKEALARWENVTGLEGELLIPLTMLGLFFLIVFLVSVCCCMVNRRKERRRKELFGRIITDLQTGDSKRLLTHSDQDD